MWKANVDSKGKIKHGPGKGQKASKRDMCIYMAEHMKKFKNEFAITKENISEQKVSQVIPRRRLE